jgi:hypothetical protein
MLRCMMDQSAVRVIAIRRSEQWDSEISDGVQRERRALRAGQIVYSVHWRWPMQSPAARTLSRPSIVSGAARVNGIGSKSAIGAIAVASVKPRLFSCDLPRMSAFSAVQTSPKTSSSEFEVLLRVISRSGRNSPSLPVVRRKRTLKAGFRIRTFS